MEEEEGREEGGGLPLNLVELVRVENEVMFLKPWGQGVRMAVKELTV